MRALAVARRWPRSPPTSRTLAMERHPRAGGVHRAADLGHGVQDGQPGEHLTPGELMRSSIGLAGSSPSREQPGRTSLATSASIWPDRGTIRRRSGGSTRSSGRPGPGGDGEAHAGPWTNRTRRASPRRRFRRGRSDTGGHSRHRSASAGPARQTAPRPAGGGRGRHRGGMETFHRIEGVRHRGRVGPAAGARDRAGHAQARRRPGLLGAADRAAGAARAPAPGGGWLFIKEADQSCC